MPLTAEKAKDLHPMKASEVKVDEKFYIKQDDGTYEKAMISQWEINIMITKLPWLVEQMKWELEQLEKQNKLFK